MHPDARILDYKSLDAKRYFDPTTGKRYSARDLRVATKAISRRIDAKRPIQLVSFEC